MKTVERQDPRGVIQLERPKPSGTAFEEWETIAVEQMLKHGLNGWTFGFSRGKRTLGTMTLPLAAKTGTVRVSRHLITTGDDVRVMDTLLHEIAHAIAYVRHGRASLGHGPLWKKIATEVGATPRATCSGTPVAAPNVRWECEACGEAVVFYRTPKYPPERYRHRRCGGRLKAA